MDFEEFKEQFAEDVKNDLEGKGIDASVKVNSVEKMNENYDALTVTPEGSNVGVNLNMNKFFEAYDSGDVDYDSAADKLTDNVYHYDSVDKVFELAADYEDRQNAKEAEADLGEKGSVLKDLGDKKKEVADRPAKDVSEKATKAKGGEAI